MSYAIAFNCSKLLIQKPIPTKLATGVSSHSGLSNAREELPAGH
jgi:hypothetical protein